MDIRIQLVSFLLSFIYGVILYFSFCYLHKYLFFRKKKIDNILSQCLYTFLFSLAFFILLCYLNDGTFHFYFILFIVFGFLLSLHLCKNHVK
ncbi:MAG: hypothetical protein IJ842_01470 [Bacilli bacterium]|nr:hypothetical protein [Bacilli bacterium]